MGVILNYGVCVLKCTSFPLVASVTHSPPEPSAAIPLGSWNAPDAQPSQTFTGLPLALENETTRHSSGSVTDTVPLASAVMNGLLSSPLPYQPATGHSAVAR